MIEHLTTRLIVIALAGTLVLLSATFLTTALSQQYPGQLVPVEREEVQPNE